MYVYVCTHIYIFQLPIAFGMRPMAEQWTRIISELLLANITGIGILKTMKYKSGRYENSCCAWKLQLYVSMSHKYSINPHIDLCT